MFKVSEKRQSVKRKEQRGQVKTRSLRKLHPEKKRALQGRLRHPAAHDKNDYATSGTSGHGSGRNGRADGGTLHLARGATLAGVHPSGASHTGLPRELEGRTLAQLSDLHVGPKVDDDYIIESFRRVQEFAPDFVAFTGDWITYRNKGQFEQLRRVLAHAPHGRLGTVGVL